MRKSVRLATGFAYDHRYGLGGITTSSGKNIDDPEYKGHHRARAYQSDAGGRSHGPASVWQCPECQHILSRVVGGIELYRPWRSILRFEFQKIATIPKSIVDALDGTSVANREVGCTRRWQQENRRCSRPEYSDRGKSPGQNSRKAGRSNVRGNGIHGQGKRLDLVFAGTALRVLRTKDPDPLPARVCKSSKTDGPVETGQSVGMASGARGVDVQQCFVSLTRT